MEGPFGTNIEPALIETGIIPGLQWARTQFKRGFAPAANNREDAVPTSWEVLMTAIYEIRCILSPDGAVQ